jgi:hypothetical protein
VVVLRSSNEDVRRILRQETGLWWIYIVDWLSR